MSRGGVLMWVQHLLGVGHLRRASVLAGALAAEGLDVTLVSGGMPVDDLGLDGVRFEQLPPLRAADASFSGLADERGISPDDALLACRRDRLLRLVAEQAPGVLITEMFPFGRRAFTFELLPLLRAAHDIRPKPAVLASVRDILTAKNKPERYAEMAVRALRWYRRILVHGDPTLVPFEASFPEARRITHLIRYTGYITDKRPISGAHSADNKVIVSAGGGAVGARLLETALAARPLTGLAHYPWQLLAGANLDAETFERLRASAPDGVTVEHARPDFPALLGAAAVSVSQAGYNTVMDLVKTRARAVLVPFVGEGETEQSLRAERLAEHGWAQIVEERSLSPERLAAAIDAAWRMPEGHRPAIDLCGAQKSARLVADLLVR